MKYILGIDAAWTHDHPSGVALIKADGTTLSAEIISGSYENFLSKASNKWFALRGASPNLIALFKELSRIGIDVDIVSLDIPLSPVTIITRRKSDELISTTYGSRGASTHTPNQDRPGQISEMLYSQLTDLGYLWNGHTDHKSFIEVYPHTAIIELFDYKYRFPYKVDRRNNYWKNQTPLQRKAKIVANLNELKSRICALVLNVDSLLPEADQSMSFSMLKSFEDCLDALICAITGYCYLSGNITMHGDKTSAIWVPAK